MHSTVTITNAYCNKTKVKPAFHIFKLFSCHFVISPLTRVFNKTKGKIKTAKYGSCIEIINKRWKESKRPFK